MLANGYLGLRGAHDEGRPVYDPAPCINRFYETWPIVYPEHAYGFANTGQTAVGARRWGDPPLVDDEPFDLDHVEILDYERALDMDDGTVERRVRWLGADGSEFELRSRRLVSLEYRHLACIEYEVTSLDRPAHLDLLRACPPPDQRTLDVADPRRSRRMPPDVVEQTLEQEDGDRLCSASAPGPATCGWAAASTTTCRPASPSTTPRRSSTSGRPRPLPGRSGAQAAGAPGEVPGLPPRGHDVVPRARLPGRRDAGPPAVPASTRSWSASGPVWPTSGSAAMSAPSGRR